MTLAMTERVERMNAGFDWELVLATPRVYFTWVEGGFNALLVDGRGGWGLEPLVEDAVRARLEREHALQTWESVEDATAYLERLGLECAREVEREHDPDGLLFDRTQNHVMALLARGERLSIARAGGYSARIVRGGEVVAQMGFDMSADLPAALAEARAAGDRASTLLDSTMWDAQASFAISDENARLFIEGPVCLLPEDELIVGLKLFFNGRYVASRELDRFLDPPLDWPHMDLARQGSHPDILWARYDGVFLE